MGRGDGNARSSGSAARHQPGGLLLSRDDCRQAVFYRDDHKCVVCGAAAVDAHHLIERRLWPDGGYYLDNLVSLCEAHHMEAEQTVLDPQQLREAAGIEKIMLPPELDTHERYDKWGNIILPNGQRSPGPLFEDASVQKVLGEGKVLDLYTSYIKYPRTPHLRFSGSINDDDIKLDDSRHFEGKEVIIQEKLDGESATLYADGYAHARSLDSGYHPSRTRLKALAARVGPDLPPGWRVCGENMAAKHSIAYHDIPHFLVFSIWNEHNQALSWAETEEWTQLLGLPTVPELYRGEWDEEIARCCWTEPGPYSEESEGFVVRLADGFSYREFGSSIAKFVRPDHIGDGRHHWLSQTMVPNDVTEIKGA